MNESKPLEREIEAHVAALRAFLDRGVRNKEVGPNNHTRVTIWGRYQSRPYVPGYDPDDPAWIETQARVRAAYEAGDTWRAVEFVDKRRPSTYTYFSTAIMEYVEHYVGPRWHSYVKFKGWPLRGGE